jgi:uncharacterized Tic20 family protein
VKKNYQILIRCLAVVGFLLVIISMVVKREPEKSILRFVGLVMSLSLLIQAMLFKTKPGVFKDKPGNPDA